MNRIFAWITALLILPFSPLASAQMLNICYENIANYPFTNGENTHHRDDPGILPTLISQAAQRAKLQVTFYREPWRRCIRDLQKNRAQGIFAAIWTPERDSWAAYPKRADGTLDKERYLWQGRYSIFVKQGSKLQWDGYQFSGLNHGVAAPPGYVAQQKLNAMKISAPQQLIPAKGLLLVALGRLDGYILDEATGTHLAQYLELSKQLKIITNPFMFSQWYLPLSKAFVQQYPEEANALWTALARERREQGPKLYHDYMTRPVTKPPANPSTP